MNNSIIDMENEKGVPPKKIDPVEDHIISKTNKSTFEKMNEDGSLKPTVKFDTPLPPRAPPEEDLAKMLTVDDIPKLVGEIATLVKSHFQGDIDKFTNDIAILKDDIKGLEAKLSKESSFTEQIHKDLWSHTHKNANPFQDPHQG